jgi:O-antigen ligase/tetratricopeptide (TPR) repeat protein
MSKRKKVAREKDGLNFRAASLNTIFIISLAALIAVPLAFSTVVHRYYSIPKITILLLCSAVLLPLVVVVLDIDLTSRRITASKTFTEWLYLLVYFAVIALSTAFGIVPRTSLFGSFENQMGLLTYFCFLICALGLVLGIDAREGRLRVTAVAMSATALLVCGYALVQFFGFDPFVASNNYTLASPDGPITRVASSLGHADYLGNFLLYTTPLSISLTLIERGPIRWLTLTSAFGSLVAIVASGTRGAWLGILVGLGALLVFGFQGRGLKETIFARRRAVALITIVALIAVAVWMLTVADGFKTVVVRGKQTIDEGFSGSGRLLLWRDAMPMVSRYGAIGCGPEAFRRAFTAYRSEELSTLAPQTVNESPHNSYLDASISFGIPGLIAFVTLITVALSRFFISWRSIADSKTSLLIAGFLSSFAAVLTHNFFIFDQITTGLYFFAFCGLAQCCLAISRGRSEAPVRASTAPSLSVFAKALALVVSIFGLAGLWYALSNWKDDITLRQMFSAARSGSIASALSRRDELVDGSGMTGDFEFQVASALALSLDRAQTASNQAANPATQALSKRALALAIEHAEHSVQNSLMPVAGYLLSGALALRSGDVGGLNKAANEVSKIDPGFYGSHWLVAESSLAERDSTAAIREANAALKLNPSSIESRSVLERAGGLYKIKPTPEIIGRGHELVRRGLLQKALRVFKRALAQSNGSCFECRIGLAEVYEKTGSLTDAVEQLQAAVDADPVNSQNVVIRTRIDDLRSRLTPHNPN